MNEPCDRIPMVKHNPLLGVPLFAVKVILLIILAVAMEKPCGSVAGHLALEENGFNLYSSNLNDHDVYAVAIGPRGPHCDERGVWVNKDGTFKIDHLPVGEYEIKAHVPGFATSFKSGIFVEEGQTTKMKRAIRLRLERPEVSVGSNMRTFTTKELPRFWINTSGCTMATIKVYSTNMLNLYRDHSKLASVQINPDLSCYKTWQAPEDAADNFFAGIQPVKIWKRAIRAEGGAREEFKFDHFLPPGDYFVVASATNGHGAQDWNVTWFSITDLGLVIKQDQERTLVRAIDLNTLAPVTNASIEIFDEANKHMRVYGTTGSDGFASINARIHNGEQVLVIGNYQNCHAYGGLSYYNGGDSELHKTLFYTDRPVYRLGQTVAFKGICRSLVHDGMANPGTNLKFTATVKDPDNNDIKTYKLKTDEHGTFHDTFEIPDDGKTGFYQVVLKYADGGEDYEQFEVAEYRKPEYQVDVRPVTARIVAGQKGGVHIKAAYYFGAPVTNAKVKYTIFRGYDWQTRYSLMDRPQYFAYFDGWDDDSAQDGGYAGEYVTEGYTVTDSNGEANVEFDTKRDSYQPATLWTFESSDRTYRVEAEVTDISRLSVIGSGSVSVTNGDFELFASSDSYVQKVGQPISVKVKAISYDGHKPVSNAPLHFQLYRRLYDRVRYQYKGVESYEQLDATTDATGTAHVTFKTLPEFETDTYEIQVTSADSHGDTIGDSTSVWIVSDSSPFYLPSSEASKEPLAVKLDKAVYQVGDVAKVMITAPVTGAEGAQAIVTMEGSRLYNYQVVDMKSTARLVEIPVLDSYAPNAYVGVTFVGKKHQFYESTTMIKVSPARHFLTVNIETDKQKYKPGDTATYTIKAAYSDGKPAANTELSLGVVDESIYAIRPDPCPDIRRFFYGKRGNAVVTLCSFPEEYSGGPDKGGQPRVRKDFKDTAVWMPVLMTDENGVVRTSIKLPDNLTTWRATVRAVTMNCEVGEARQKIITTQDLILRLSVPRFFTQGDRGTITAVVHNYTQTPQVVCLNMSPCSNFTFSKPLEETLTVRPDSAARYSWPVTARLSGEATLLCSAKGSTAGDAMQITLPVRPLGVESFITRSGIITATQASINIPAALPPDAAPGSGKLHVYLSCSPIGSLIGNFASLIDYPYGCTEQTMSKLMPSVVAVRLSQSVGLPLSADDKAKFKEVYKQSMTKLNGYQHQDGGWGWWADDTSQVYLTALVLDGYKMLEDAGYKVPTDRRQNGIKFLRDSTEQLANQLTDPLLDKDHRSDMDLPIDLSRGAFVLSRYRQPMSVRCRDYAMKTKDKLAPEALAYFAMAFANLHDAERAKELYDRLIELANVTNGDDGTTMDWSPTPALLHKLHRDYRLGYYSYRYTDVETTALALQAICAIEPDNSERMAAITRWILVQRGKDGWDNTKTTAQVLRSVMLMETKARHDNGDANFTATIGGSDVAPLVFGQSNVVDKEKDLKLKPLTTGVYTLTKAGAGRLYYTSVLTYYKRILPGQYVAEKSMPDGLKLRREFFRLQPSKADANGNIHFTAKPLQGTVRAGETLLMKVYVDIPDELPYVMLDVPLPSGAEVVQNDPRENAEEQDENDADGHLGWGYWFGNWWWTHQDVMDDHLAFFVSTLPPRQAEFHQMIRMELPGKFEMNPVTLEGMYTKGVRAYSHAGEIEVVE